MGYTSEAIGNYMTLLGWSPPEGMNEIFSLEEAAKQFSFDRVNKAGAKFDWDKLNWINSQYLHSMPIDRLIEQLIPYWQQADYPVNSDDRAWLEQLTALIAPSLERLEDAVAMTRYLFISDIEFTEVAQTQLRLEGVAAALKGVISELESVTDLTAEGAQAIVQSVVKSQNVKKGLLMKSLRAALTGDLKGPDLVQSWLLLHQHGMALPRLQQALTIAEG